MKYIEDCNYDLGLLICSKKPKKDRFLIGKNKVYVLDESELEKIKSIV